MKTILELSAGQLANKIQQEELSVQEVLDAVFRQIDAQEDTLNCYISTDKERALKKAEVIQKRIRNKENVGRLCGVPIAVKDNICTEGIRTTCASRILENFIPSYSAHAVSCLENEGAIIIGKTNMDEFAMGSTTETSAFGITRNPWNTTHVPGGSSGGSAAAVASSECMAALGTDTGGSIRQPASYCGVVGLKPTYKSVSRYGLVAYASSFDQIGPITKNVADAALLFEIISSYDKRDASMAECKRKSFLNTLCKDVSGMKIGIPKDYLTDETDDSVKGAVLKAAEILQKNGAEYDFIDIGIGMAEYAIPAYYTIADAEASSNLSRYDGVKYGYRCEDYENLHDMYRRTRTTGFGKEVKNRLLLGAFVLSEGYYDTYYLKAQKVRTLLVKRFQEIFSAYDVLLAPVSPTAAPRVGESLKEPLRMYQSDICTIPANLAGFPAISVPVTTTENQLPIGVQIMAAPFCEERLLQAAYSLEQMISP